MSKEICVMDTSSLINTSAIELAGMRIIQHIDRTYEITVPNAVSIELGRRRDELLPFIRVEREEGYGICLEIIQKWFSKIGKMVEYGRMGPGEKECIALALYLSRQRGRLTTLLMDDSKADPAIDEFLRVQVAGFTVTTTGIMVQIFGRQSRIGKDHVLAAINDYMRMSPPKRVSRESFYEKLFMSCRVLGSDICFSKCL